MSTKASFWLRGKKGQLAGTTVYQSKGRTIQREIVPVSNPQTRAQMEQRVKWPNLVNTYKLLKPIMKYAFENKKGAQSDYNALMSVNASAPVVPAITKGEARMGVVIPAPYTITRGSLPSITDAQGSSGTNIMSKLLTDVSFFDDDLLVKDLTKDLLMNNSFLREGMQLSLVALVTEKDSAGVYTTTTHFYEVVLDSNSTDSVYGYFPKDVLKATGGYLGLATDGAYEDGVAVSAAFILSETISGKTRVSTEKICLNEYAQPVFEEYTSASAINAAINSYGVQENAFLSSAEANKA